MEYGIWNIGYWLCPYNRSQTWPYLKPPPTFKPPSTLALTVKMAFWQLPCSQSGPSIVCSSHNNQSDLSKREIRPWSSLAQNLPVASYCSYNRRHNPIQVLKVHCIWPCYASDICPSHPCILLVLNSWPTPGTFYSPDPLCERLILQIPAWLAEDICRQWMILFKLASPHQSLLFFIAFISAWKYVFLYSFTRTGTFPFLLTNIFSEPRTHNTYNKYSVYLCN